MKTHEKENLHNMYHQIAFTLRLGEVVGSEIIIPKYFNVMGAIGMAIMARRHVEQTGVATSFKGFDFLDLEFTPKSFECTGCSNSCEVIKVMVDGQVKGKWKEQPKRIEVTLFDDLNKIQTRAMERECARLWPEKPLKLL